jgi:hypothetical protein
MAVRVITQVQVGCSISRTIRATNRYTKNAVLKLQRVRIPRGKWKVTPANLAQIEFDVL